jgi:hypothetical protein
MAEENGRGRVLAVVFGVVSLLLAATITTATAGQYGATYQVTPFTTTTSDTRTTVAVTVKNTGTLTWNWPGAKPVFLSYHWLQGAQRVKWEGVRTPLPNMLPPNGSVTLSATVQAPTAPGNYTLSWDMVREGGPWFSESADSVPPYNQTVKVEPLMIHLSKLQPALSWPGLIPPPPEFTGVEGLVTPGADVILRGYFGPNRGSVFLNSLKGPGGPQIHLRIDDWQPDYIKANIPAAGGRIDCPGVMTVLLADHQKITFPIYFRATRETKQLSSASIKVARCTDPWGSEDSCNEDCGIHTLCGEHWSGGGSILSFTGDDGRDEYQVSPSLKNGWEVSEIGECGRWSTTGVADVTTSALGSPDFTITVDWKTPGRTKLVIYRCDIFATGPLDVPY